MQRSSNEELPDCCYQENQPSLIKPSSPTPNHMLHLSNLDDQKFLRFSIKYIYLFQNSVTIHLLKLSLSRVLVDYYPLAGRLKTLLSPHDDDDHGDDQKLQVDCNGEGATNVHVKEGRKLQVGGGKRCAMVDEVEGRGKGKENGWEMTRDGGDPQRWDCVCLEVVTKLRCGGMIVCTSINHCLCDGIGTSQFLHDWAYLTTKPIDSIPITPFHSRHMFKPRSPSSHLPLLHPAFTKNVPNSTAEDSFSVNRYLHSQPLVPASLTYTASNIMRLKSQCVPSIKCTTFEVLASHTWLSWVKSLNLAPSLEVKLLFSMNIRNRVNPKIPKGYYANGFVLACAKTTVKGLVNSNLHNVVKLVQEAKLALTDDCVNSILEMLEDKNIKTDLTASLVISQWSKLGLEDLDFGEGKPLHMGPLTSDIYCLFLPVIGHPNDIRVLVSLPKGLVSKFEYYMNRFLDSNNVEATGNCEK
ncbi:Chloramphenicol acetyltransferase-like domain-containing protein [Cynara cardunculus var. scolymus]|uniref:Chloramphenicol acetyltransferase-like domain-containing protein n=1 Tax=Cynara cardunculus var. scolymus TaxID=59895 RepID=A0A103XYM4_CYNCS|nr:Chloramphenicol acetyltransferase-like domain-containing protein [Cynara cardunculus var. scolymus]